MLSSSPLLQALKDQETRFSCILCFDFDGTMINPDQEPHLDPDLMLYIAHLRSRGAAWVVNTGRTLTHVVQGLHSFGFEEEPDFIIARESELLQPGPGDQWEDVGDWNMERSSALRHVMRRCERLFQAVKRFVSFETESEYLSIRGEPDEIISTSGEEMDRICEFIDETRERRGLDLLGYQRNGIYLRFGHRDFNKGTTLSALSDHLGLEADRVFAAGDNLNDLEMLSGGHHAAHVACPANALPSVKNAVREAGGFVARSDFGRGMMEALGHYFFR